MMEEAKFPFSIILLCVTVLKQPTSNLCQCVIQNYPKLGFCLFQSTSMSNFSQARTRYSVCERGLLANCLHLQVLLLQVPQMPSSSDDRQLPGQVQSMSGQLRCSRVLEGHMRSPMSMVSLAAS